MLIFAHLLNGISVVIHLIVSTLLILIVARAIISWVNPDPYNPIVRFLADTTDPLLRPFRRVLPVVGPGFDLSPLVLLLLLYFVDAFFVELLRDYAYSIRAAAGVVR